MTGFDLERFLPFRLNRLAAEVSERLARIYAERFDIDVPQWRVLATLSSGDHTAQAIVSSTRTHKSTISRAVQALEERRWIARVQSGTDRRAYVLRLTADGRRALRALQPLVLDYERRLLQQIGAGEAARLEKSIAALEAALELGGRGSR
jgi:DNA-binding MarR family transcriptional regulator